MATDENNYFQERCTGGCKQTEFWKTMKPYFSKKSCGTQSKIILQDNDKIVTKNVEVAEGFNKSLRESGTLLIFKVKDQGHRV
jgi:hypothetical protein